MKINNTRMMDIRTVDERLSGLQWMVNSAGIRSIQLFTFELCSMNHGKTEFVGYFDNAEIADTWIQEHQNVDIYFTPQQINPRLIERNKNTMSRTMERTKEIIGWIDSGSKFYGKLDVFNQYRLFIIGNRGQRIIIKRGQVARLEAV